MSVQKIIITAIAVSAFVFPVFVMAESSRDINATIKLSVCGDNVIELPEDCEGTNLNGKSCNLLGYSSGNLNCDIACSFDTTNCILISSPTPSAASTVLETNVSNSNIVTRITNLITNLSNNVAVKNKLPKLLMNLDPSNNNKIEGNEVAVVARTWINSWSNFLDKGSEVNKCDMNADNNCNLSDFSILLYYVDR
jgi:hypothetical protein